MGVHGFVSLCLGLQFNFLDQCVLVYVSIMKCFITTVQLEIWDGDTPSSEQLNYPVLCVCFHMKFKIFFSVSVKISVGMLVWIALNL